jgi:hypothetical protein
LNCKIDQLSVNTVNNSSPLPCSLCGGIDHLVINYGVSNEGSFEKVNIISQGNFSSNNNFYSNTCNSGWRNHLIFLWRQNDQQTQGNQNNQGNSNFNRQNQRYGSIVQLKSNIELMMEAFMASQN